MKLTSLTGLVVVWWVLSFIVPARIVPSPSETAAALYDNLVRGRLTLHFTMTMLRVAESFVLAMLIGIIVGTLMGLFRRAEVMMDLWVMVALTIPGLCYIVVSYIMFGMNEFATVLAISLSAFPSIAINVWEGVKNVDNRLADMARAFRASRRKRLMGVIIPQILPYIVAASRFGLGIIWKITVVAELLGRSNGVGFQLHYWFQLFNMPQVFAWTLFFTIIMLFLELGVLKQVEVKLFSWRPAARL